MKRIKNLMFARNVLSKLTDKEIEEIENDLYQEETVLCVDAEHFDETGDTSEVYTWFIPSGMMMDVEPGDILVVEQVIGIGLAFVRATTTAYTKTKEQHESDIHPYCRVISNLGKVPVLQSRQAIA